jgi:hypothetical protein
MTLFACHINAQPIKTTFKIIVSDNANKSKDIHFFAVGDSVTIHAYKKKEDKHYFIIETSDYANLISNYMNPFNVEEKTLKKLPNALKDDMTAYLNDLKRDVDNRIRHNLKNLAYSGGIKGKLTRYLVGEEGSLGKLDKNNEVYVLGYIKDGINNKWAIYTDNAAGVFRTTDNQAINFDKKIDVSFLPSINDPDVIKSIQEKKDFLLKKKDDQKKKYREIALRGDIKGVLMLGALLNVENLQPSPFSSNDSITILGYSDEGKVKKYALYASNGAGIFKAEDSSGFIFKNASSINFDALPSVDDPEVKQILEKKKYEIESRKSAEKERLLAELNESKQNLIDVLKMRSPVVVECDSWTSNSAGGIEVSVSVTNCSNQTIKYITIQGAFYNAVGDKCRNEIGGGTVWKARGIGPIGPMPTTIDNFDDRWDDCKASYTFDNLTFYSRVADTFKFTSITIEYMNGKTITLSGNNLKSHVKYD